MPAFRLAYRDQRRPFRPTLADLPALDQYLLLSMLLHVLVILLLGDAGGGMKRGERLWGAIDLTLLAPAAGRGESPSTSAMGLREERARRAATATPSQRSVAATATMPSPQTDLENAAPRASVAESAAPAAAETTTPVPRIIAREVEAATTGFVVPPPASVDDVVSAAAANAGDSPAAAAAQSQPSVTLPPLSSLPPLPSEREAVHLPARMKLPEARATVAPLPRVVDMAATPSEREYTPRAEALPKLAPLAPTAAPSPLPAAAIDREFVRPADVEPLPTLSPLPAPTAIRDAPARIDREFVPPAQPLQPVPRMAPLPPAAPTPAPARIDRQFVPPAAEAGTRPAPTAESRALESRQSSSTDAPTRAAPNAASESEILRPRRESTIPPGEGGTLPRLNADAVRQRAREIAAEGSGARALLQMPMKPAEPHKSKEQQAFDKALKRSDCRDAYADMGLAAVAPLLWSAVSDKGCRW